MARPQKLHVLGRNRLLTALPRADHDRLRPELEHISSASKDIIYDVGQPIPHVYFPLSGMFSLLIVMADGSEVEVGMAGNEGMIGTPVFLGADRSPAKAVCQVPGGALRMKAEVFTGEVRRLGPLHDLMQRYTQAVVNQISQSVACNHRHSVEERLCRWLLMTHDRVGADEFPLTQEFLAQMLGVRRPSVTVVACSLQKDGLIQYHRGRMTVLNRKRLEEGACECYGVVKKEFDRLLG
jgi:CRP-like cAMP-binding protein